MAKFKKNKLFYKNPKTLPENNGHGLFAFKVKGVEKFQSNNPDKGVPKVKLLFELGHNGVILLKKAKAFYENSTTNIDSKASSAKRKKGENSTKKNETNVVSADLDVSFFDGFEKNGDLFDRESLESAIKILEKFEQRDAETVEAAEAINQLEGLIYKFNDLFETENFATVTLPEEREITKNLIKKAQNWIDLNRDPIRQVVHYNEQIEILRNSTTDLVFRLSELSRLPKAVDYAHEFLNLTNKTIQLIITERPWISNETISGFLNKTNEFVKWLNENIKNYSNFSKTEKPVFVSDDVIKRIEPLQERLKEIALMEKIEAPKTNANATRTVKKGPTKPSFWRKRRLLRRSTLFEDIFGA